MPGAETGAQCLHQAHSQFLVPLLLQHDKWYDEIIKGNILPQKNWSRLIKRDEIYVK